MLILVRFNSRTNDQLPSLRIPIQTRNELERIDPDRLICISHLLQPRFLSIPSPPSLRLFLSVSLITNCHRVEIKRLQNIRRQIPFVLIPSWIRPGFSPSFLSSSQIVFISPQRLPGAQAEPGGTSQAHQIPRGAFVVL